jgi:hypothetical protein
MGWVNKHRSVIHFPSFALSSDITFTFFVAQTSRHLRHGAAGDAPNSSQAGEEGVAACALQRPAQGCRNVG